MYAHESETVALEGLVRLTEARSDIAAVARAGGRADFRPNDELGGSPSTRSAVTALEMAGGVDPMTLTVM